MAQIKFMNLIFSKNKLNSIEDCSLLNDLKKLADKRNEVDILLQEIKSTIHKTWINPKNILQNLDLYQQKDFLLSDDELDSKDIFTLNEIEKVCIHYRMCFLDAHLFKNEIPAVAEIKIEYLNEKYHKNIQGLKILSYRECFTNPYFNENYGLLFAPTENGNYYLIHQWGKPISPKRKWINFPLRNFESLAISLIIFTLIVDLILPTHLITLDRTATYWSGYRLGVYFHLLIFFGGFTIFAVFAFFKNLSNNIWNHL
jgi:hypothetical protein